MTIGSNEIVFKPIIPLSTMIPYVIVLTLIIIINRKHIINRLLILALLLVITQRPMLKDKEDVSYTLNLDIVFVVDTTVSMNAEDVGNGTRLDAAKKTINNIIEELPGSRYAVITFNNNAFIKYPFTSDIAVISDVVNDLKIIDPNYAIGSSLSLPSDFLKMLLESSQKNDSEHDEKRQRIVFFMGDGELNNKEKNSTNIEKYNGLEEMINNGAVIGIGTKEGGKIKITSSIKMVDLVDSSGYLLDNSVNPPKAAISKLYEDNLKEVASKLDIDYFNMSDEDLKNKIEEIKTMKQEEEDDDTKNDKDLYYYFTFASLVLMIYELFYYRRNEL